MSTQAKSQPGSIPLSERGKVPLDPKDKKKPPVLHDLPPKPKERVKNRQTHRVTPRAKAFIIQCVLSGYTNGQINKLLRTKQFIMDAEPDLSHDTLCKIRKSEDCLLDPELLTREARQVGHAHLSKLVVGWVEISDQVFERLLYGGTFGANFEHLSVAECTTLLVRATRFFLDVFGVGLGEWLRADREGENEKVEDPTQVYDPSCPGAMLGDNLGEYVRTMASATLDRALREYATRGGVEESELPFQDLQKQWATEEWRKTGILPGESN